MTETKIHPALIAAQEIAPTPTDESATRKDWGRHYAAQALAAYAAFTAELPSIPEKPERGSRLDLGMLIALATSSMAAAIAILMPDDVSQWLWDLTPSCGALNGEYEEWLAETLDGLGINPAAIDGEFSADDFKSAMPSAVNP